MTLEERLESVWEYMGEDPATFYSEAILLKFHKEDIIEFLITKGVTEEQIESIEEDIK